MRAIVIDKPGGPDVLALRDVPAPSPSRGEVRVRVRAAGVNRADLLQRMGRYPAPPGAPADIPGMEFAGEVDALGEGVRERSVGDRVFGLVGGGGYAEHVVLPEVALSNVPEGLTFAQAAAIPEVFLTAWDAMVTQAGLTAGETVLVHGVGSGVGTAAVQIGRAVGARVLGTARAFEKTARARELGLAEADAIVTREPKFAERVRELTGGRGVDVVLDLIGGDYVVEDLAAVAIRGRILVVGLLAGSHASLDLALLLRRRARVIGTVMRARALDERLGLSRVLTTFLVPLFERGLLRPVVDRTLPLARASDAHAALEAGDIAGKVVLEV